MRGCPSQPCGPGCFRQYPTSDGEAEFPPLIRPASRKPAWLSFSNLIEAHVLRSLRAEHGVSVKELRRALSFAEKTLGIDRLLLRPELRTDAGRLFLDRYGELIDLTASGQLAMRKLFEEHLKCIEWDSSRFPVRLYPFLSASAPSGERPIVIDPRIAFGRPVVVSKGIATSTLAERIDAGEKIADIAADYDLAPAEVEQAVVYERGLTRRYFTDRDLGKQFGEILKAGGLTVERHADHFAPDTPDDVWLAEVDRRGWIALTRQAYPLQAERTRRRHPA